MPHTDASLCTFVHGKAVILYFSNGWFRILSDAWIYAAWKVNLLSKRRFQEQVNYTSEEVLYISE